MAKTSLDELRPENIALIKPSALGDVVHSLPVLHALRTRLPQARITWVINRSLEPLLIGHPDLNETLPFDRRGGLRGLVNLARELHRRRFDLVIDLQGLLRTGLMCAATRAARRIGLSSAREGSRWFYSDVVRDDLGLHAVDRYWRVAEALGAGDGPKRFVLPIARQARDWVDTLSTQYSVLRNSTAPLLVVASGSRWPTKRWPHFAGLVNRAQRAFGGAAILVGSAEEISLSRTVAAQISGPCLDLTGRTRLPQLVALLDRADVVLANDSGPLHLAAALGRPVVAPYTCTKVAKHGPYGQVGAVETSIWCGGSYLKRCSRLECMAELTPDRLWPALEQVLTRWASRCRSA
jgi:lipopolysaccharide heptosyltransferase I